MIRAMVWVLFGALGLAQVPRREPVDVAIEAYWTARNAGHFDQSADKRAEARALLEQTKPDVPQFGNWAQSIASLYSNGELTAQARAVLEVALSKTSESHPARVMLLAA